MNILFICTGNTCRSPMAEYIARELCCKLYPENDFNFDSAGLNTIDGLSVSVNADIALSLKGIDASEHLSKLFRPEMLSVCDLILCMTGNHRDYLRALFPGNEKKIYTIGEYSGSNKDIPDPYGGNTEIYCETADVLEKEMLLILKKLVKE